MRLDNIYNITLGEVVVKIIQQNDLDEQECRFYMLNNSLLNSPIEIDAETDDPVLYGDLYIKVCQCQWNIVGVSLRGFAPARRTTGLHGVSPPTPTNIAGVSPPTPTNICRCCDYYYILDYC